MGITTTTDTTEAPTSGRAPTSSIYALLNPTSCAPIYVGRTAASLRRRLERHLCASKLAAGTALAAWLRNLAAEGQRPLIALLETVEEADWRAAERRWIARLRALGFPLVNMDEGGTGPSGGYSWTPEACERLRASKAGRARGGTSRFPGVSWHRLTGRWAAQLCGAWLGLHDDEQAAFCTYLGAYHERFGGAPPGWEGWSPIVAEGSVRVALGEIGSAHPTPKTL